MNRRLEKRLNEASPAELRAALRLVLRRLLGVSPERADETAAGVFFDN